MWLVGNESERMGESVKKWQDEREIELIAILMSKVQAAT